MYTKKIDINLWQSLLSNWGRRCGGGGGVGGGVWAECALADFERL